MDELKRKYEASMRDVLHILGQYDYQYIKEYVEYLENTFIQLEQNYDKLWDSVHSNPPLKFEELKVGMWVFDLKQSNFKEIEFIYKDFNSNIIIIGFDGYDEELFEENRFYRKQVEE